MNVENPCCISKENSVSEQSTMWLIFCIQDLWQNTTVEFQITVPMSRQNLSEHKILEVCYSTIPWTTWILPWEQTEQNNFESVI